MIDREGYIQRWFDACRPKVEPQVSDDELREGCEIAVDNFITWLLKLGPYNADIPVPSSTLNVVVHQSLQVEEITLPPLDNEPSWREKLIVEILGE